MCGALAMIRRNAARRVGIATLKRWWGTPEPSPVLGHPEKQISGTDGSLARFIGNGRAV
jgi:hypothetical protein